MPRQASPPGFDPEPQASDSLFFAIFPDAAAAARIAQLAQQLRGEQGLHGKPLKTERFHVTLHHLGNYVGLPQELVTLAGEAAASVLIPPFEVAFDRAGSFTSAPRHRPLVLRGGEGLMALSAFQHALGVALVQSGLQRWAKPGYTPHATLLYDDRSVAEQAVETIAWMAREFVLVHSQLGEGRYIPLGRWPLREAPA
ncbi:2'-5' RNA ligase family protein [Polaromonas sp. UC242_47]|uniref:2'-5' RNA ligase family protein n=1 Tax=Polaromonas sp. UC242_47 TaxID=3374626 RepID=UPI0037AEA3B0